MEDKAFADRVELALLSAQFSAEQLEVQLADANRNGFAGIQIAPVFVTFCKGRGLHITAVIGYPLGLNKASVKAIEATVAVKDGAGEVAIVPHYPNLKSVELLKAELMEIARGCRAARRDVLISVIVDPAEVDVELVCRAVRESGCDSVQVKSANVEMVRAWKLQMGGLALKVCANDVEEAGMLIGVGADRIILNSGVAVRGEVL